MVENPSKRIHESESAEHHHQRRYGDLQSSSVGNRPAIVPLPGRKRTG
jgi:hypothetical protein